MLHGPLSVLAAPIRSDALDILGHVSVAAVEEVCEPSRSDRRVLDNWRRKVLSKVWIGCSSVGYSASPAKILMPLEDAAGRRAVSVKALQVEVVEVPQRSTQTTT